MLDMNIMQLGLLRVYVRAASKGKRHRKEHLGALSNAASLRI